MRRTSLAFLVSLASMGVAVAQDSPAAPAAADPAVFERLDTNKDGTVTDDEVGEEGKRIFRRLLRSADKNEDGKLTKDEFQAGLATDVKPTTAAPTGDAPRMRVDPAQMFQRLDANGDGKIALDEVPAERKEMVERMLPRLDADKDGKLSPAEFKQFFAQQPGGAPPAAPTGDAPRPMGQPPLLTALDADKDGEISKAEIAAASEALAKLDRNGDGKLDRSELGPPAGPRPDAPPATGNGGEMFLRFAMQADKNSDGKISKEEAPERMKANFERVDGNGDGFLDETELKAIARRLMDASNRPDGPQAGAAGMIRALLQADKNGDGKLSKDEAPERLQAAFEKLDANGDGQLDEKELAEMAKRRLEEGRRPERKPSE